MNDPTYDVIIVGAGPVGRLLGLRLRQLGVRFTVLEKRAQCATESRSIGIHPPGERMFDALGIGDDLRQQARRVQQGFAYGSRRPLGHLQFSHGILALSQANTMQLLDLPEIQPGVTWESSEETDTHIHVRARRTGANSGTVTFKAKWLVACDGHHSAIRPACGIRFPGKNYPDHFIMGDFPDDEQVQDGAHIFVHRYGLAESLPLNGGRRRWVVRLRNNQEGLENAVALTKLLKQRTGHQLAPATCTMVRKFTAQRFLADRVVHGRTLLAGDAAHVMSPIGGQGMNVGWMDAWELANLLATDPSTEALEAYNIQCRRRAITAANTAEHNMRIGRPSRVAALRSAMIYLVLRTPFKRVMDQLFTLQRVPFNFGPGAK